MSPAQLVFRLFLVVLVALLVMVYVEVANAHEPKPFVGPVRTLIYLPGGGTALVTTLSDGTQLVD